jgi:hypothetical protein
LSRGQGKRKKIEKNKEFRGAGHGNFIKINTAQALLII